MYQHGRLILDPASPAASWRALSTRTRAEALLRHGDDRACSELSERRQPDRALSEVGATKAIAHRGNVGSACVRREVTLDRVTSGTNRDEAKQRLAILTFVEE
jgi:hypothetical protein